MSDIAWPQHARVVVAVAIHAEWVATVGCRQQMRVMVVRLQVCQVAIGGHMSLVDGFVQQCNGGGLVAAGGEPG